MRQKGELNHRPTFYLLAQLLELFARRRGGCCTDASQESSSSSAAAAAALLSLSFAASCAACSADACSTSVCCSCSCGWRRWRCACDSGRSGEFTSDGVRLPTSDDPADEGCEDSAAVDDDDCDCASLGRRLLHAEYSLSSSSDIGAEGTPCADTSGEVGALLL